MTRLPEVWLRGPVSGIPPLLQPVAHALLQCREEITASVAGLTSSDLFARPGGIASIGFHVRHAGGSLDRLFTYARGEQLSADQMTFLRAEGDVHDDPHAAAALVREFDATVERALSQLRGTSEDGLLEPRFVGRARLPSTVLGLLFHAAEHTQRHAGQIATTARLLGAGPGTGGQTA